MNHPITLCALFALAFPAALAAAEVPPTGVPQAATLRMGAVTADRQLVPLYEMVEFTVDLQATYDNPFDPDQLALDAEFRTPSGKTERLPGFYYQGFDAAHAGGRETLTAHGPPAWKVRYTPREKGDYTASFRARDRSGETATGPVSFQGPKVGSVSLSPRGDWRMPSDASATLWLEDIEAMYERLSE